MDAGGSMKQAAVGAQGSGPDGDGRDAGWGSGPDGNPHRADALQLLDEWVENEGLRNHMLAVEAAVRHYARLKGADEELWGLAGLLHDLDWEKHPDEHPLKAVEELETTGYPDEVIQAILAHRSDFTGWSPRAELDRVLIACDELSGLVVASCLVRPNGIDDLKPKSVREEAEGQGLRGRGEPGRSAHGIELIGLERNEHIQNVIDGLRAEADSWESGART
jgi:putative nucleotidyltransferase with HDIG domain